MQPDLAMLALVAAICSSLIVLALGRRLPIPHMVALLCAAWSLIAAMAVLLIVHVGRNHW